jgi:serine/threonine-protein kinase
MAAMGRIVAGQYELIGAIGRGPTGTVWRAERGGTREAFAVKLLDAQFASDLAVVDRFVREQHVLSAFTHPAMVRVRDLITDGPDLGFASELVAGPDLRQEIGMAGSLAPEVAVGLAGQCAEALAAAHAVGVVHCDVKPANVLIGPSREARLTDCRVARLARGHRAGVSRFGSPEYAAPEVILGGPPVTATDVYGLGLVLYEALLGTPLCYGDDAAQVLGQHLRGRPVVPVEVMPGLREVLEATLAVDPQARPEAAELAGALRRLLPALRRPAPAALPAAPLRLADPPVRPADPPPGRPHPAARHTGRPAGHAGRGQAARPWLRPVIIVAAVALVLALAGIILSSLPAAQGSAGATGTPSAPAKPAAGRSAPQLDASATAPTTAGAAAFVRYWFATLNYAVATGKTGPLSAASSPACHTCAVVLTAVSKGYQNGAHLQGGEYTVREATTDGFFSLEQPKLGVVYDRSPYSIVSPGGDQLESSPGVTFATCQMLLEQAGDRWRVRELYANGPVA